MSKNHEYKKIDSTIVSGWLLRATAEDWSMPETLFIRIQANALNLLLSVASSKSSFSMSYQKRALLIFDCFLRVIDEPVISSSLAFATPRFKQLQEHFYGALGSTKFINLSELSKISIAYNFYIAMKALSERASVALPNYKQGAAKPISHKYVEMFNDLTFNGAEVQLLRPYLLTSKAGTNYNVLIGGLVPILGEMFTASFHQGLCSIAQSKAKDTALRDFGSTFTKFVVTYHEEGKAISPELLNQPHFVQDMMVDFMEYHIMKIVRRADGPQEGTLGSLQKLWSRYINYWGKLERLGVVAAPAVIYPSGNPKLLAGSGVGHRRVKTNDTGKTEIITHKLLTPVPLHLSDEEATKLIFEKIKSDFAIVQSWVRESIDLL